MKKVFSFVVLLIGAVYMIYVFDRTIYLIELCVREIINKDICLSLIFTMFMNLVLIIGIGIVLMRCDDLEGEVEEQKKINKRVSSKIIDLEYEVQDIKSKLKKIDIEKES